MAFAYVVQAVHKLFCHRLANGTHFLVHHVCRFYMVQQNVQVTLFRVQDILIIG